MPQQFETIYISNCPETAGQVNAHRLRGVEFPREENRGRFEDIVVFAHPAVFGLQSFDLGMILAREAIPASGIDRGLRDPASQRLVAEPLLSGTAVIAAVTMGPRPDARPPDAPRAHAPRDQASSA